MATYTQRHKIERDSISDPLSPPSGSTQQDVEAAIVLRNRIRSTVLDLAVERLAVDPLPESGEELEQIGWARAVLASPDGYGDAALRLALAHFDALTPAQILDPNLTDQALHDAINALVPALATGFTTRR